MCSVVIVVICLISGSWCVEQLRFPPGFYFGVSTSAGQVEGAWNISGKSESIYDRFTHTQPELIADGSDGDVACDSYHLWRRDIQMLEELGVNMYRFSISWTRLLPSGFPNHINPDGVRYYSDLIDALLERGIEPLVTIYHFEQPQSLQDLGGWANPLVVDWFADYARVVYTLFADRVKYWVTINEPFGVCDGEYGGIHAPAFEDKKIGRFLCNKYLLLAHAAAWRIYDEEFKPKYHGKVSVTSIFNWFVRRTPNDTVTELATEFWEGRYTHPIFSKQGGWPPRIEKLLAENAKREGYSQPRLPPFTPEEIEFVKGTYDYYGLNHYTSKLVRKARPGETIGAWPSYGSDEIGIVLENDPAWEVTDIDWFAVYPEGLRQHLHWLNETYGPIDILIGENGYPSLDTGLQDKKRLSYIQSYLEQLLLAMKDGISVIGYNVWSLMDNFEWRGGYTIRFGLYAVNFSDPLRERTARDSAKYYASVVRSRAVHSTHDTLYEI